MAAHPLAPPRIVAVGFRRINKILQELAPSFAERAAVEVLDVGFEQAVSRVRALQRQRPVDVVVAAGSNGGYLRQHLDTPVVMVKVGGFDLLQALSQARRLSERIGLVTYEGMAPDLSAYDHLFGLRIQQRSYRTEDEARVVVQELQRQGVEVVVGSGVVADSADAIGLTGIFLYSVDAVREALEDAVEVARAARIEQAKRDRLHALLAQLSDGVIAVDEHERIVTLNPAMAQWLGVSGEAWIGRVLHEVCPELSLQATLRSAQPEVEHIEQVRGKPLIVSRMPIIEQGVLTGAVLTGQDPISIQRVDRHIRTRSRTGVSTARYDLSQIVGRSAATQRVQQVARQCAASASTVLLIGESGTGKELIAQGIHQASERREFPFVAVNCAAMSETLLESELFGYEEGAFTGARRGGKVGLFEAAHRGTIFLDEVGEMPLALQTRLLRVLQEREVVRVGATEPTPVNVRVIAATHRDLGALARTGAFRSDLFYRLNILRIDVPPLRERVADMADLVKALWRKVLSRAEPQAAVRSGDRPAWLTDFLALAQRYPWPGNVRELENIIERCVVYGGLQPGSGAPAAGEGGQRWLLTVAPELGGAASGSGALVSAEDDVAQADVGRTVPANWQQVLAACGGDRQRAAQALGVSRTTLWRWMKKSRV